MAGVSAKQRSKRVHKEPDAEQDARKNTRGEGSEAYVCAVVNGSVWETGPEVEEKQ